MPERRVTIRRATRADAPIIFSLIRELAEYEKLMDTFTGSEALIREHLFPDPGPARAESLIGEIDGKPEGYAVFFHTFSTFLAKPGMFLEDIYVRPGARGAGLGRALLTHVARLAVERGCARMEWMVLDWNEPAIGFYKKLGATALDEFTMFRLGERGLRELAVHQPA